MTFLRKFLFLLVLGLFPFSAFSGFRVIYSSDHHPGYLKMVEFIKALHALSHKLDQDFVIVLNGDLSGASGDTRLVEADVYGAYASLGTLGDVIITPGNHGGLDFNNSNQKFLDEHHSMLEKLAFYGKPTKLLAANYIIHPNWQYLFDNNHTITLKNGKKLRFVGLGIPYLEDHSGYVKNQENSFVEEDRDSTKVLIEQLELARKDEIDFLIPTAHIGFESLISTAYPLIQMDPENLIKTFHAGHRHQVHEDKLEGRLFIESGALFTFHVVDYDDDGNIINIEFIDAEKRKKLADNIIFSALPLPVQKAIKALENSHEKAEAKGSTVIATEFPISTADILNHDKKPTVIGLTVAETYKNWFLSISESLGLSHLPVLSMLNTLSLKSWALQERNSGFTLRDLLSLSPYPEKTFARVLSGAEAQKYYEILRKWGIRRSQALFVPIINQDWIEMDNYQLVSNDRHQNPLKEIPKLVVLFDAWLSRNGYSIAEEVVAELIQKENSASEETEVVIRNYLELSSKQKFLNPALFRIGI